MRLLVIMLVVYLFLISTHPVRAADQVLQCDQENCNFIHHKQIFEDIHLLPGDTVRKSLKVVNDSNSPIQLSVVPQYSVTALEDFIMVQIADNTSILVKDQLSHFNRNVFVSTIQSYEAKLIEFTVQLDPQLPNSFQNMRGQLAFEFFANTEMAPVTKAKQGQLLGELTTLPFIDGTSIQESLQENNTVWLYICLTCLLLALTITYNLLRYIKKYR